ncbi:MAG: PilZ domain-containing protein [Candidatus Omnitrophica bacterium]|nr:PilZ domain-containing protein [Candidatus Omnitrophota bacterium]
MEAPNHRGAQRVKHPFMVRCRLSSSATSAWAMSPLRDLSASGARFVSEEGFAVGDELDLQLLLPVSKDPLLVRGKVAWVKPGPMALREYGVAFELADERSRQLIAEAVAHFTKKSQEAGGPMGAERRQFPRVYQTFEVQYRLAGQLGQGWKTAMVVNLSASGMRFHAQEGIEADTTLEVQLALPNLKEPLVLFGAVAWCRLKAPGVMEHGLAFQDLTPERQSKIDDLVRFLRMNVKQ